MSRQAWALRFLWQVMNLNQYCKVNVASLVLQILDQRLERGGAVDSYKMVALLSLLP
jgi:hypothetical protein